MSTQIGIARLTVNRLIGGVIEIITPYYESPYDDASAGPYDDASSGPYDDASSGPYNNELGPY